MASTDINKYQFQKDTTLFNMLFFKDDEIYIQSYDPVNGRPQKVFAIDKEYLGNISSDKYWQLKKSTIVESKNL